MFSASKKNKGRQKRPFIQVNTRLAARMRLIFTLTAIFLYLQIIPAAAAPFSLAHENPAFLAHPPGRALNNTPPAPDLFRSTELLLPPPVLFTPEQPEVKEIPPVWQSLTKKLIEDGFDQDYITNTYYALGECYSAAPMGNKILELYRIKLRRGKVKEDPDEVKMDIAGALPGISPGVLTMANMNSARKFMAEHKAELQTMQETYGVEPEIAVAIILVETGFGTFLGNDPALQTLSSMAACRDPEEMRPYLKEYAFNESTVSWLSEIMPRRADWAYAELKALLAYGEKHKLDLMNIPGSVYGAVGLCQFMPSNIEAYGVDATDKGWTDLFTVPDALSSLANYLKEHGWTSKLSAEKKHEIIMRYNKSRRYANTIITVADYLKTPPGTPLPAKAFRAATYKYKAPKTPVKPRAPQRPGLYYGDVPLF